MQKTALFQYNSNPYSQSVTVTYCKHPYGMLMDGRSLTRSDYGFGFGGMEKITENNSNGSSLDFGARIYDGWIGRWLSCDPKLSSYPSHSPYNYVLNNPISNIDPNGEWVEVQVQKFYREKDNKLVRKSWYNVFKKTAHIETHIIIHNAKAFIMYRSSYYNEIQRMQSANLMMEEISATYCDEYNKNAKGPTTNITVSFSDGLVFVDKLSMIKSRGRRKDNFILIAPSNAIVDLYPLGILEMAGSYHWHGMVAITPEYAYLSENEKIENIRKNNRVFTHEMTHYWLDDDDFIKEDDYKSEPVDYLMYHSGRTGHYIEY